MLGILVQNAISVVIFLAYSFHISWLQNVAKVFESFIRRVDNVNVKFYIVPVICLQDFDKFRKQIRQIILIDFKGIL